MNDDNIPDLLHPVATTRVDLDSIEQALKFAFAAGGSDVPLYECLGYAGLAFSTWSPECFERDLFLETFIEQYKTVTIKGHDFGVHVGHLTRVLSHPPADVKVARFRQAVLAELLERGDFRHSFEHLYATLQRFRGLLGESGVGYRLDLNRRRLDVLEAVRAAVEGMSGAFEGATSGLQRLRTFGAHVAQTQGYARLSSLLQLESNMGSLEARLGIGYDGQLKSFEIVRISEQTQNPFHATRVGRLWRALVLFMRGYRFSDAEVLGRLVDEVFEGVAAELAKLFQLLGDMEFYLVALRFFDVCKQRDLAVCLPELFVPKTSATPLRREIVGLFNPLLMADVPRPTPCTLSQGAHTDTVLLTGPNSGGKTRVLQALSLTQLLGQSGFFVPAERASLVWASGMFLSISEHPDAGQREGRLGTELLRIRKIFESLRFGAFIVLDELCAGTNPAEGEEVFRMVLTLLRGLHPQVIISTHFLEFARRLQSEPEADSIAFLQVELDAKHLPTYQFVAGVASASLAKQTAARLGVTREELTALVERHSRAAMG